MLKKIWSGEHLFVYFDSTYLYFTFWEHVMNYKFDLKEWQNESALFFGAPTFVKTSIQ